MAKAKAPAAFRFEYVGDGESPEGRFQCADSEGREVVVEAGSTFETDDGNLAAYLRTVPWVKEV